MKKSSSKPRQGSSRPGSSPRSERQSSRGLPPPSAGKGRPESSPPEGLKLETQSDEASGRLPAGDFSDWLHAFRAALLSDRGLSVPCGDCVGCCSASYFIHVRLEDRESLKVIPKKLLVPAPLAPRGTYILGHDQLGRCALLTSSGCSIYPHRPLACRIYDCRIFAATGLSLEGKEQEGVAEQARRWAFDYRSSQASLEQEAVRDAVAFIREHAECFAGRINPDNPTQVALLSLVAYSLFLKEDGNARHEGASPESIARDMMAMRQRDDDHERRA